ncbi:hypothetical protein [Halovivax cerinus]|uniref:Uncharacterized protein n=1 Tax=Halovivax cerinus TaxID=1487865 RepID=A0ABD5NSH4_9EURY|nr:hypothetical protein [Halovivax cerinus]
MTDAFVIASALYDVVTRSTLVHPAKQASDIEVRESVEKADERLVTDGGAYKRKSVQTRLDVGDTRKPRALEDARRVTTGDLAPLAMCAHRFEPSGLQGWYTHEFDDVLRQWICSNVGSVIARLSPHCEDRRGELPPLHRSEDLWRGEEDIGPTQVRR